MTREEFKRKAEEFASMYVSDYAMVEGLRVVLDEEKDHEEGLPTGRIAFRTCRDETEQSVPICVGAAANDELDIYIPDCDGHALDPQNFYVYLWNEACERAVRAEDTLLRVKREREDLRGMYEATIKERYALERILGKLSSVLFIQAGHAVLTGPGIEQLDAVGHLLDWAEKRAALRPCSGQAGHHKLAVPQVVVDEVVLVPGESCRIKTLAAPIDSAPLADPERKSKGGPAAQGLRQPADDMAEMIAACDEVALLTPEGVVPVKFTRPPCGEPAPDAAERKNCNRCGGSGNFDDSDSTDDRVCPKCKGSGQPAPEKFTRRSDSVGGPAEPEKEREEEKK